MKYIFNYIHSHHGPHPGIQILSLNFIFCLFLEKKKKRRKEKFLCVYAHFYLIKIIFLKIAYQLWFSHVLISDLLYVHIISLA